MGKKMDAYIGVLVLLMIIGYLAPKDTYEKYYHFMMGLMILIMLVRSFHSICNGLEEKGGMEIEDIFSGTTEFFREEKEIGLSDSASDWLSVSDSGASD